MDVSQKDAKIIKKCSKLVNDTLNDALLKINKTLNKHNLQCQVNVTIVEASSITNNQENTP